MAEPLQKLTPQETKLLGFLAEGYSYLNAAGQLGITVNTGRNIYEKLHVHTKSEAVSKALRAGLLD